VTSRATFGDLAAIAIRHLEAPAQRPPPTGRRGSGQASAEADEFLAVLPRMLKTISRYTADIAVVPAADHGDLASAWVRAASEANEAAQNAYRCLPVEKFTGRAWSHVQLTSSLARDIDAAATAITTARDLLHTHSEISADGTRRDRSEWAPVIASARVQKALLGELAGWSRHIVSHGTLITAASRHYGSGMTDGQRRVLSICRWLTALITGVETAHDTQPVTRDDVQRLHGIPASMPLPRRIPAREETIGGLHLGIAECSERARSAAAAVQDAAWSSVASAESFSQAAVYATVISHHCEILQQSLAARAAQLGATQLRNDLLASAKAAAKARQGWLMTARAWYHIKTDATGDLSPAAEEAADLAVWTGRLAYADPSWTLTTGPSGDHRPPQQLAPDSDAFTRTVAAVHQAAKTLTTLAAADYNEIRTAARDGRLFVPATQVPAFARTAGLYARAPRRRTVELLTAYRDAGTSSVTATAKIAAITSDHQAVDQQPARRSTTSSSGRSASGRKAPGTMALTEPAPPPGPIERILFDLGVTDPELLNRGTSLDEETSQLIAEAADQTAPQRWHSAVVRPGAVTNTAKLARDILAADSRRPVAELQTPLRALANRGPQAQPEAMQAEP
jgi:hypothetical protein